MVYQVKGTKQVQFEEEKQKPKQKPKYKPKGSPNPESDDTPEGPQEPKPSKNKQKNGSTDLKKSASQKLVYRPKGELEAEESKGDLRKEKDQEKTLVYNNPMDFVERKNFKKKKDEYYNGDWKKLRQKIFVTLETVIPEMPEQVVTAPDENAFHKKMAEISEKIKDLGGVISDKHNQFGELVEQKQDHRKKDPSKP